MADLKDILKIVNKGKKEEDQSSILGTKSLARGVTSTGSVYLDYITGGGFLDGGYNTIVADGGTGKSSVALLACKDNIDRKKKYAVYFDGEGTVSDSYIDRMGVNRDFLIVERGRNLEDMLDKAQLYSTADDVGIIIIDSIPIYVASSVSDKSASDNHMAVEARRYTTRMPIIEGNCTNRGITIIGLTSYKLDPGAMGDPRTFPRGKWQITMNNTLLDLTRKEFILDSDKQAIGHVLDVRVKKSKNAPYNPKDVFSVNFYYDGGFNQTEEFARLFIELEIVKQGGAWITYYDQDGIEGKVNGTKAFIEKLKEDKVLLEHFKKQLYE